MDELRVYRSAGDFAAFAGAWDALIERCPGYYFSQTRTWAEAAWHSVAEPAGRALVCPTLWSGGRLVAVWPLVVDAGQGVSVVRQLSFEGSEYCLPLVEPGGQMRGRIERLWQVACGAADVALLTQVRSDSLLDAVVRQTRGVRAEYGGEETPSLARAAWPDFDSYLAAVSPKLRQELRRGRRRLAGRGTVWMGLAEDFETPGLIDWLLERKRHWLAATGRRNDWIGRPGFRDFLQSLARGRETTGTTAGRLALFVLKVDGAPVAASLVSVDRTRVEGYLGAFDPAFARGSPGNLLMEHVLRWAFERGLNVDFRLGGESYKRRWAMRGPRSSTVLFASGWRGLPEVGSLALRLWWGRRRMALSRFLRGRGH